jgi:hypothetical protein
MMAATMAHSQSCLCLLGDALLPLSFTERIITVSLATFEALCEQHCRAHSVCQLLHSQLQQTPQKMP